MIMIIISLQWLCAVVAGLLHYLFLCVFCWMLAEAIMLYLMIVKVFVRVFGRADDKWYYLLPLGWGKCSITVSRKLIIILFCQN